MKASLLGFSVLLVAALTAACGSGDQNNGNGGSGGTGGNNTGGTNTGGKSTGGTGAGGSTGGSNTGGTGAGGSTGGTGTGGSSTGGGGPCGGLAGLECGQNEWCDFPEGMCGGDDGQGQCTVKPSSCPDNVDPVCACDGTVYDNACEAEMAGYDLQTLGGCQPPVGEFPCGSSFCVKAEEYCQVQISDVAGVPNSYDCLPLPANCDVDPTCNCLSDLACGNMCELTDGGLTLTCPGG